MEGVSGSVLVMLAALTLASAVPLPLKTTADKAQQFVDKCRSHCIVQLTPDATRKSCLEGEQCLRCWASCKAFQSDHYIRDYCKHNKACTEGCRQACLFYLTQTDTVPSSVTSGHDLAAPRPVRSGQLLTRRPVVVSLARAADSAPDTAVYSLVDGKAGHWEGNNAREASDPKSKTVMADWTLRLAGMVFGPSLVTATVWWRPRGPGRQYVVTWELLSGGLRGHLVSEETSASLPLWPDERYLVQVFSGDGASQPLQLDTHQSATEAAPKASPEAAPEAAHAKTPEEAPEVTPEEAPEVAPQTVPASGVKTAFDADSVSSQKPAETAETVSSLESAPTSAPVSVALLSPVSPLESAALLAPAPASESSTVLPVASSSTSSAASESGQAGRRRTAPLTLLHPQLALLLAAGVAAAGLVLGMRRRRSQQPCSCDQQPPAEPELSTDDRHTLLSCSGVTRLPPQVLSDPRRAPLFIVPCHKR